MTETGDKAYFIKTWKDRKDVTVTPTGKSEVQEYYVILNEQGQRIPKPQPKWGF